MRRMLAALFMLSLAGCDFLTSQVKTAATARCQEACWNQPSESQSACQTRCH